MIGQGDAGAALRSVLAQSHELGFIGDPDLGGHIDHALGFATAFGRVPERALDLGSGGGLPGLVLALHWPDSRWVLLDGSPKRTAFLAEAVAELELDDRVRVVTGRAEEVGHEPAERASFDLVVSRSFGPPAVVAECAAPFLAIDGSLVVSEPREGADRWAFPDGLAEVGLVALDPLPDDPDAVGAFRVLVQRTACPPRYPRRVGMPAKRPLFS